MTTAFVFANGTLDAFDSASPHPGDLVIAADGGLRHVFALGLQPSVVIGDLDSAPNELVQIAENRGVEIIRHPVDKDKTDLELALDLAAERGADEVVIAAALGGRLDHALGNVLLLQSPRYSQMKIRLVGGAPAGGFAETSGAGRYIATIVSGESLELDGTPGDIVSLLPLASTSANVTITGLRYPLQEGSLELGSTRGISNVMTSSRATVSVQNGMLLVVHIADSLAQTESPS